MQVLVWSIADHVTTLTATGKMHNAAKGEKLKNRTKLEVLAVDCALRSMALSHTHSHMHFVAYIRLVGPHTLWETRAI